MKQGHPFRWQGVQSDRRGWSHTKQSSAKARGAVSQGGVMSMWRHIHSRLEVGTNISGDPLAWSWPLPCRQLLGLPPATKAKDITCQSDTWQAYITWYCVNHRTNTYITNIHYTVLCQPQDKRIYHKHTLHGTVLITQQTHISQTYVTRYCADHRTNAYIANIQHTVLCQSQDKHIYHKHMLYGTVSITGQTHISQTYITRYCVNHRTNPYITNIRYMVLCWSHDKHLYHKHKLHGTMLITGQTHISHDAVIITIVYLSLLFFIFSLKILFSSSLSSFTIHEIQLFF